MADYSKDPTIFHITHWKAGSQWVYVVLRELFPDRIVHPKTKIAHVQEDPIQAGMIYPTVYLNKTQFDALSKPAHHKCFFVIRDLRDTLVSRYFSLLKSHPLESETGKHTKVATERPKLQQMSLEEGMQHTLKLLKTTAEIQMDWCKHTDLVIRYEDMLKDEMGTFKAILNYCELEVDPTTFEDTVKQFSFTNITGRSRGTEDTSSHFRKGIAGDWRNYFDDKLKEKFKEQYGDVLIHTEYEQGYEW